MKYSQLISHRSSHVVLGLGCKSSLDFLNRRRIGLERLCENPVVDAGAEHGGGGRDGPSARTPESRHRQRRLAPLVVLEMHQSFRKHKHVPRLERSGVKLVSCVDEADVEGAYDEE